MTDTLCAMYPDALDCGMSADDFWNATPVEIVDRIESHRRKMKREQTLSIERLFVLAEAIGSRVAYIFSDQRNAPNVLQPWDMYPQLFKEERQWAERSEEDRELQAYKEARKRHAAAYNQKRREAGS